MLTDHDKAMPAVVPTQQEDVQAVLESSRPKSFRSVESHFGDMEGHHELGERESSELDLNYYRLVNEVWHFCSVDWGSRCKFLALMLNGFDLVLRSARSLCWI